MTFNYQRHHDLVAAEDIAAFRKALLQVAEDFGFPLVNLIVVNIGPGRKSQGRVVRNDPLAWVPFVWDAAAVARDPCVQLVRSTDRPFAYDQDLYVSSGAGDLWEQQAPFGFKTGIGAVLHSKPGRRFCAIGMDRNEPLPGNHAERMRLFASLQLLVAFVQDAAYRLLLPDQIDRQVIDLSARERDVLAWASQGKSAWETGMLLAMSEHAVSRHLTRAVKRLGCASKAQAVAKAFETGLL
jgi:DNA-binding CsgD family transcriptional regulator